MSDTSIADSQSDSDNDVLAWEQLRGLRDRQKRAQRQRRQDHLLQDLRPLGVEFAHLPRGRTRCHGFCQRHVYTADLSEFLELASRIELDRLSKDGQTDDRIIYMLNRKYTVLRKFYESLGVKHHKFKKRTFDLYLEDFKKYQTGRDGRTIYEAGDQVLEESQDRRTLRGLLTTSLEDVETTDEEEIEEEQPEEEQPVVASSQVQDDSEQLLATADRRRARVIDDSLPTTQASVQRDSMGTNDLPAVSDPPAISDLPAVSDLPAMSDPPDHSDDPSIRDIPSSPRGPLPLSSPTSQTSPSIFAIPDVPPAPGLSAASSTGSDALALYDAPPQDYNRRMRRHKFSQDHVYVTDTAVHLGIATAYSLNDMYEDGKSYAEIMAFLDDVYQKKRDYRRRKEIGYGPFSKPTFKAYLDDENRHLRDNGHVESTLEKGDHVDDQDNDIDLDEEYILQDTQQSVQSDDVFKIPSDDDDDDSPKRFGLASSQDTEFVFRQHTLKKKSALHGVLPNSFYRLNAANTSHSTTTYRGKAARPPAKGVARRKSTYRSTSVPAYNIDQFVTSEDEVSEHENPADYHIVDREIATPDDLESLSSPSVGELSDLESEESDDGVSVNDYDMFIDRLKTGMDMEGMAMEDHHSGINYMLSKASSKRRSTSAAPRRKHTNRNRKRRPFAQPARIKKSRLPSKKSQPSSRSNQAILYPQDESIWLSDEEDPLERSAPPQLIDISNVAMDSNRSEKTVRRTYSRSATERSHTGTRTYSARSGSTVRRSKPAETNTRSVQALKRKPTKTAPQIPWDKGKIDSFFYFHRDPVHGTAQLEGDRPVPEEPVLLEDREDKMAIKNPNIFIETVNKLDRAFSHDRVSSEQLDKVTLKTFASFQLKPKSIVHSNLIEECLQLEGDYRRDGDIVFEYDSVRFTIDEHNLSSVPELMQSLLAAIHASFTDTSKFSKRLLLQLKKCLVKTIWLLWTLHSGSPKSLRHVGRQLLKFIREMRLADEKLLSFVVPYELVLMDLMHKFMHNCKDPEFAEYERETLALEKQYIGLFCSMDVSKVHRYFSDDEDGYSVYYESACLFCRFSSNPWQHVAELAKSRRFHVSRVMNFLYFLNSQSPVLVDWEYFIGELETLGKNRSPVVWKMLFKSVLNVIHDLGWSFEEDLLVKMFRLLSESRFENIGTQRPGAVWYASLPRTVIFSERDGCLDMYLKFLVLYVQKYADSSKQSSLIEKLVPIAAIKTSTIPLLKNRANLMLVMSYLFNRDFVHHFKIIFRALLHIKTADAYRTALELILVLSRCYHMQFQKLPMGIIRGALPKVIDSVNDGHISVSAVAESFRNLTDCFARQLVSDIGEKSQLGAAVDLACILVRFNQLDSGSRVAHVPVVILSTVKRCLEMTDNQVLESMAPKLKNELVVSLKTVITSEEVHNDRLKAQCLDLWIYTSWRLQATASSLLIIEWPCFATETIRTKFELPFHTALLNYYQPVDLCNHQEILLSSLLRHLPVVQDPFFHAYFIALAKQSFMQPYISFKSGLNPSRFTERDVATYRQQITVKVLARLVGQTKKSNFDKKYTDQLGIFVKALEAEFNRQKVVSKSFVQYKDYVTRICRYLYTVIRDQVERIPEFHVLRRDLSITQMLTSLSDQLESVSSKDELYLLLEDLYIRSIVSGKFRTFRADLVNYCLESNGFIDEEQRTSPLLLIAVVVCVHTQLALADHEHWVYLMDWFAIFTDLIERKVGLNGTELCHVIKVLTYLTRLSNTGGDTYKYYEDSTVKNVYLILTRLSLCLIGYEDRQDFYRSIHVLAGVDNDGDIPVDPTLFASLAPTELDHQIETLYTEKNLVLQRFLNLVTKPDVLAAASAKRIEARTNFLHQISAINQEETPGDSPVEASFI